MPCISFIVPVYNMERLLPRALRSLRAQTLTDFEAILINDGSKDGSAALCAQAAAEDARFRFIDQPNGGVATARNAGLDAARGEYIFFLDPDDWVEPDAAEVLYHAARNADADCVEFGLYLDSYDENDRLLHTQTSGSTLSGVYRGAPFKEHFDETASSYLVTPYGPWKRLDEPILKTKPNTFYSFLTSNPSPIIQEDGSVMMIFKGRHYTNGYLHSAMSLGMAYAPTIEGPYRVLNNDRPIFEVDGQGEAEDPFLWKDANGYHAIFKDHVAKFTGERGGGVMAHSKDGIQWTVDKDPKAYSLTVEWEDGSVEKQGQLERPFILFEDGKPAYIFFATMDGPGGFENASRSWNMVIPIKDRK